MITRRAIVVCCAMAFAALEAGCIDVGHAAETGCLVDMTEPGCHPNEQGPAKRDAAPARDANAAPARDANAPRADARSTDGGSADAGVDVAEAAPEQQDDAEPLDESDSADASSDGEDVAD